MARDEALFQRAKVLLEESHALLLKGDFTLASGLRSPYYLDSKMFSLDGEGQYLAGELLYSLIREYRPDGFGGMEVSAVPLVGAIARASFDHGEALRGFYVKKEAKGHGTSKKIEGHIPRGGRVVVIDDVVTTGGSALEAVEAAEKADMTVVAVIALVERHEGGGKAFTDKGYEFCALFRTDTDGNVYPGETRKPMTQVGV